MILDELIPQNPLFWNYENYIHAYLKSRETKKKWKSKKILELKKYLKNGVELKLFERKLEFWNLFENWSLENYLKIGILKIKFKNWNFGN